MPGMLAVIDYAETRTNELEALLLALQYAAGPHARSGSCSSSAAPPPPPDLTDTVFGNPLLVGGRGWRAGRGRGRRGAGR
ncbi:hypothetical protein ACIP9X_19420, partial [Arthrobacter sp. NPDC093125]|uniref:hypothetical protein n=1 Tax=Arthrobacter sp. NPDC093125 TaxID=3363944 RepID=UPI003806D2D1